MELLPEVRRRWRESRRLRREARRRHRVPWEELQDLLALNGHQFEEAVAAILREMGFRAVRRTGRSGDLSVDITFRDKDNNLVAVQCKRYTPPNRVGSVEVQQFYGMAKLHHKADFAMYVTTSDFTRSAVQLAAQHPDLQLINGVVIAEMLANVLGAPGKHVLDPAAALEVAGLTPASLVAKTRERFPAAEKPEEAGDTECGCRRGDVIWSAHREPDGRPVLVCPHCERFATAEEVHEAMIHGTINSSEAVPGLEPLRKAARQRWELKAIQEEDVRFGLLFVPDKWIVRKREQAARAALKQILGRRPTEREVNALATASPPSPEDHYVCSVCGDKMPWSRRLGAYWCRACSQAEFPMAERMIRLTVPTPGAERQ